MDCKLSNFTKLFEGYSRNVHVYVYRPHAKPVRRPWCYLDMTGDI